MIQNMLTIAICTCDRHGLLVDAVESIFSQEQAAANLPLLIIDNSTEQRRARIFERRITKLGENIEYVITPPHGLSAARNRALSICETSWIAYMDDDALLAPDWLSVITQTVSTQTNDIAAVGGPVLLDWKAPRPVWLPDELLGYLSALDMGDTCRTLSDKEWLVGTNMVFRSLALKEIGGFTTHLGRRPGTLMSNEELDALNRLRRLGYQFLYEPHAKVVHTVSEDRLNQNWFRRRIFWQAISDEYMNTNLASVSANNRLPKKHFAPLLVLPNILKREKESAWEFAAQCLQIKEFAKRNAALAFCSTEED